MLLKKDCYIFRKFMINKLFIGYTVYQLILSSLNDKIKTPNKYYQNKRNIMMMSTPIILKGNNENKANAKYFGDTFLNY